MVKRAGLREGEGEVRLGEGYKCLKLQKREHKVGGAKGRGGSDRRGLRKRD